MKTGEKIAYLRESRGIKQKELAKMIELDPVVLNRIEKGKRPARDRELFAIANVLDTSTDEILGRGIPKVVANVSVLPKGIEITPQIKNLIGISKDLNDAEVERVCDYALYIKSKQKKAPAVKHGAMQAFA